MKISAVIITHNEEERLPAALQSLEGVVSEIIVVDSFSTDGTVKIAHRFGCRVFEREWSNYADQKNYGNSQANYPWILSLDADERLSPELREEIISLLPTEPDCVGFSMPRQVFYLGRWIRHGGWYPDRRVRLFRRDKAHWEGEFVHEKLVIEGEIRKLRGNLLHFTYRNITDHMRRINLFSELGAKKLYAQRKKCRWYHLAFLPPLRFLRNYLFLGGFLDGFPGLIIAVLSSYALFARYAKLKEIWLRSERIESLPR
ncbi:MAG: glycosyltransferase family 2 protein [Candidatus Aminicenantes bacterium]|nr:glycosyltransferase family 2 protein [Candidatus Aminicenantes bacterium]